MFRQHQESKHLPSFTFLGPLPREDRKDYPDFLPIDGHKLQPAPAAKGLMSLGAVLFLLRSKTQTFSRLQHISWRYIAQAAALSAVITTILSASLFFLPKCKPIQSQQRNLGLNKKTSYSGSSVSITLLNPLNISALLINTVLSD